MEYETCLHLGVDKKVKKKECAEDWKYSKEKTVLTQKYCNTAYRL